MTADEMTVDVDVAEEQAEAPRNWENVANWVREHPRRMIVIALVLALPYLLICNGMAIMVFATMIGAGGCGG
jgi:hypothetical protein